MEAALGDDEAAGGAGASAPRVRRAVRLNHRWIDLRTPANQGIMRIQAGVMLLFREFLSARGFVEIMTPKLLSGASEGGAEVFTLKYFGRDACLAQSPQLYKQMVAVGSDFGRVFEVGPVFRAENANTHKHLTEFHGLDMEMTFKEHYYEVLEVFSDLFIFIFEQLNVRYKAEIEAVRAQYPFEDFKFCKPSLKLTYAEGIELLRADGCEPDNTKDLGAEEEKRLGRIVKEKYGTDFFMMDRYPMEARPFYSMPCPDDPSLTNSYDFFMRGEEILSGAQRVHDPELLAKQAAAKVRCADPLRRFVEPDPPCQPFAPPSPLLCLIARLTDLLSARFRCRVSRRSPSSRTSTRSGTARSRTAAAASASSVSSCSSSTSPTCARWRCFRATRAASRPRAGPCRLASRCARLRCP